MAEFATRSAPAANRSLGMWTRHLHITRASLPAKNGDVMSAILMILAIIAAIAGAMSLSQATLGVGTIALACFLGILARLAQAEAHHRDALRRKD